MVGSLAPSLARLGWSKQADCRLARTLDPSLACTEVTSERVDGLRSLGKRVRNWVSEQASERADGRLMHSGTRSCGSGRASERASKRSARSLDRSGVWGGRPSEKRPR